MIVTTIGALATATAVYFLIKAIYNITQATPEDWERYRKQWEDKDNT